MSQLNMMRIEYLLLRSVVQFLPVLSLAVAHPVFAESEAEPPADPPTDPRFSTNVQAQRPLSSASSLSVSEQELRLRPIQRTGDLLRVAPGLITVQHAGGGKANQYLLRGFDADHGTDIALSVDGVPINMVSHGHGQGYADASWVLPELIERIEIYKGPYFVEQGDFATAGAINLVTKSALPESFASVQGGMFQSLRVTIGAGPKLGPLRTLFLAEGSYSDGPFDRPERFHKYNLFAKLTYDLSRRSSVSLAVSSYGGDWSASGQLPKREVEAGRLSPFGSLDPSEGGSSARQNLYLTYQLRDDSYELTALVYLSRYTFKLLSNFTLFSRDPIHGDGIEQADERYFGGLRASFRRRNTWRWLTFDTSLGIASRFDDIHNSLYKQAARERLAPVAEHQIGESSLALYAKEEVSLSRYLRIIVGLRADYFHFQVTDLREDLATVDGATSGMRGELLFSPKATLVFSPHRTADVFVNFGRGFHSNDARGVVLARDPVTPLSPALGYEVGVRTRLWDRLDLTASLWGLDLESELVWVGDEGTTESSGATRRLGGELTVRLRMLDWLFSDLDVTANDARFTEIAGNGGLVALAPRLTVAAGLSVLTPFGLRGSLRFTGIGSRPATEDDFLVAEGAYLLDASLGYRWRFLEVSLFVENLTNSRYRSAQFATTSRLRSESSTGGPPPPDACPTGTRTETGSDGNFQGCEDLHFTPGYPINVQGRVTFYF
jgi:outer membrane receptor protein involved in Fe transport